MPTPKGSAAGVFVDDRDHLLYRLIRTGNVELAADGKSATFTRAWADEIWWDHGDVGYANDPDAPFPGSLEDFVEGFFEGLVSWRNALTKRGRAERTAAKKLRGEWRATGRMQVGPALAGILRRTGRLSP